MGAGNLGHSISGGVSERTSVTEIPLNSIVLYYIEPLKLGSKMTTTQLL
jgi:hypothetical protein